MNKIASAKIRVLENELSRLRGVPHESASGELAYSELKVLEDYIENLKSEISGLKTKRIRAHGATASAPDLHSGG